jgi:hypothetical protein
MVALRGEAATLSSKTHRSHPAWSACRLLLFIGAAASLSLVAWTLARRAGYVTTSFEVSDRGMVRLDLLGLACAAVLLWFYRGAEWRRRCFAGMVAVAALLALALISRRASPSWPTGDGAMTELYTIHAAHGAQLLGVYSQYGWHHPGRCFFMCGSLFT